MGDGADHLNEQYDGHEGVHACRRCGEDGFFWTRTVNGWRLADAHDNIHVCTPKPKAAKHPITEAEELDLRRRCERAEAFCRAYERHLNMPVGFCTAADMAEREAAQKALHDTFKNWKLGLPK